MNDIERVTKLVLDFEREAKAILAIHESSSYRLIELEDTYNQLEGMSLLQDELFRQAIRCAENGLFRAAHVMAWAAFMDFIHEMIRANGFEKINAVNQKWNISSIEDLREHSDYSLIDALHKMKLCTKSEMKSLHGSLNKRNECAHPSDYFPNLNETLGYISELLQRTSIIKKKNKTI